MARVVFMGSPAFAVPSLHALHDAGHEIVAVYTQPPRPAGRGQKLQNTAVHEAALGLGLPVFHPEKLRGADLEAVLVIDAEVFCVVAYGLLLPKALVDARVCLNVHPSRLPRWRGAAPLQWTLISGDTTTDVCVMRLDEGMDTGPVVMRRGLEVPADWNLPQLHDVTARMGADMLVDVVAKGDFTGVAQVGEATPAVKITKDMRRVDWGKRAEAAHNLVRGIYPAAQAALGDEVFKILRTEVAAGAGAAGEVLAVEDGGVVVACGEGAVRVLEMQRAGGKPAAAADVARGWPELRVGARLQ